MLQICIDGVQTSLAEGHYETAVEHIENFYKDFLCKPDAVVDDIYIELLEAVEEKLKATIQRKTDQAIAQSNFQDIER